MIVFSMLTVALLSQPTTSPAGVRRPPPTLAAIVTLFRFTVAESYSSIPPPLLLDMFPLTVVLVSVAREKLLFSIPPPVPVEVFPLTSHPSRMSVPVLASLKLKMPPPLWAA